MSILPPHTSWKPFAAEARLAGELYLVDSALAQTKVKVLRPLSFAYCGNTFGPEAAQKITALGYKFARRGWMRLRQGHLQVKLKVERL